MNWRKVLGVLAIVCLTLFLFVAAIYAAEQYKQQNREAISQIVDGKHDKAIKHFENYLKKHPEDLESMYGLAVAYTQKNDIVKAVSYTREAIDAGLPFSRFLAGPRDLLKPLTDSAEFKQLAKKHSAANVAELLNGPLLGSVTDSTAKIWVRTANEVPVQVAICKVENRDSLIKSPIVRTDKNKDFTAVITVEGLKPDTPYWYSLI